MRLRRPLRACLALAAIGIATGHAATPSWRFIPGTAAAEDLVAVPGTNWLVASALNIGAPASLKLVDGRAKTAAPISFTTAPIAARSPACRTPPDPARMSTKGLALARERNGTYRLYAANHGDRRAIEMFRLDARGARPTLVWEGCAVLPPHTLPNAVAALPDGDLLVVSFHDPDDATAWDRMVRGEDTGRLLRWRASSGFHAVPGGSMSGGNGIALAPNGRTAYVSAWSGRKIMAFALDRPVAPRDIPLPFLPDNLHMLPDGTLLAGGQRTDVASIARCKGPACAQPWVVARIDPRRGAVSELAQGLGDGLIDYACGALLEGDTLFVTARGTGGIAYRRSPVVLQR